MQSEMRVLNHTGDLRYMWDKDKKAEVEATEKIFKEMKSKGYLAYTVDKDGEKGRVIRDFDPKLERIIMTPQMIGG